jgi:transcriptional regulator with XRE-family HTH domain
MKEQSSPPTDLKELRRILRISQEEAARLLNVSKNTWIRWERRENYPDQLSLRLLPFLARQECPESCDEAREKRVNRDFLAKHVPTCRKCWLMIQYLARNRFHHAGATTQMGTRSGVGK